MFQNILLLGMHSQWDVQLKRKIMNIVSNKACRSKSYFYIQWHLFHSISAWLREALKNHQSFLKMSLWDHFVKIHTWVPESACVISKVSIIPLLALALDGLLIGAPVDRVNGGRAFDLDVSSLCERFILHLQPKQNFQTKTFKLDRFRKRSSVEPYLFNSHRNANARFDLLQITWMFNFPIKPWPAGTAGLKYSRVC